MDINDINQTANTKVRPKKKSERCSNVSPGAPKEDCDDYRCEREAMAH